jgi:hypothetical protein
MKSQLQSTSILSDAYKKKILVAITFILHIHVIQNSAAVLRRTERGMSKKYGVLFEQQNPLTNAIVAFSLSVSLEPRLTTVMSHCFSA